MSVCQFGSCYATTPIQCEAIKAGCPILDPHHSSWPIKPLKLAHLTFQLFDLCCRLTAGEWTLSVTALRGLTNRQVDRQNDENTGPILLPRPLMWEVMMILTCWRRWPLDTYPLLLINELITFYTHRHVTMQHHTARHNTTWHSNQTNNTILTCGRRWPLNIYLLLSTVQHAVFTNWLILITDPTWIQSCLTN